MPFGQRQSAKGNNIMEINTRYKDLVNRESLLLEEIEACENFKQCLWMLQKILITIICAVAFWCYCSPAILIYFFREIPRLSIAVPSAVFVVTHFLIQRQDGLLDKLQMEKIDLKPKLKDIERMLRDNTDPELYKTYKRMILKEEEERIERLKVHKNGCSEKCRVKNTMLEIETKRNKDLVDCLSNFQWCNVCAQTVNTVDTKNKKKAEERIKFAQCNHGCS